MMVLSCSINARLDSIFMAQLSPTLGSGSHAIYPRLCVGTSVITTCTPNATTTSLFLDTLAWFSPGLRNWKTCLQTENRVRVPSEGVASLGQNCHTHCCWHQLGLACCVVTQKANRIEEQVKFKGKGVADGTGPWTEEQVYLIAIRPSWQIEGGFLLSSNSFLASSL